MKKPYNFAEYNLINENKKNKYLYKIIILLFLIEIIVLVYKFDFYIYERNILLKEDNSYSLVIDATKINTVLDDKVVFINKKKYNYELIKIDDDYQNINGTIYQTIYINIPNYNKNIKIVNCYFLKSKKTLIDMLIEFIKGG